MGKRTKKTKNCSPEAPKRNQERNNNAAQPAQPPEKDGRTCKRPKRKATETDLHVKVPTRKVRFAGEGPSHQKKKRRCDGEETPPSLLGTGGGGSNLNTSVKYVRARTTKRKANTATTDKMPRKKRKQDLGAEDVKKKEEKKKAPVDPQPQMRKRKMNPTKHQSDECGEGTSQQNATQPAPPPAKDGRTSKRPKRKATETDLHIKVPARKVRFAGEGPSHQNRKRRCDGEETPPSLLGTGGGGSNLNTPVKYVRARTAKRKANTATADKMPRKKRKQDLGAEDVKKKEEKKKAPADPQPQKRKRKMSPTRHQSDDCGEGTSQQKATQPAPPPAKDGQEDERNKEEKKKAPEDPQPQKRQRKMSPTEDQSDDCSEGTSQQGTQQKTRQDSDPQRAAFLDKYQEMHEIGEGAFGTVFAGHRRSDNLPVAIKHIPKKNVDYKPVGDDGQKIPVEVDIMMKLKSLGLSAPISLLDWYELKQELILVLERPDPCVTLFQYIQNNGGCLSERTAKIIMKQLVAAAKELEDHEIFHRDIREQNILIETGSDIPRVRLIDFGMACYTENGSFEKFAYDSAGTVLDFPRNIVMGCTYRACPFTVWQLGMIVYDAVHRFKDVFERFEIIFFLHEKMKITAKVSRNCKDFLKKCLTIDAKRRATLEELQRHPWLR